MRDTSEGLQDRKRGDDGRKTHFTYVGCLPTPTRPLEKLLPFFFLFFLGSIKNDLQDRHLWIRYLLPRKLATRTLLAETYISPA